MTERPILFSAPMVRAILSGTKTQTRRVLTPQPPREYPYAVCDSRGLCAWQDSRSDDADCWPEDDTMLCPYGQPGDRLWVRETFLSDRGPNYRDDGTLRAWYRADVPARLNVRWTPSIHMPRWASRITLEVTGVRVERVQYITEGDAQAEGVDAVSLADVPRQVTWSRKYDFRQLWDKINAKRGFGWDVNPWVWVIEFVRVNP